MTYHVLAIFVGLDHVCRFDCATLEDAIHVHTQVVLYMDRNTLGVRTIDSTGHVHRDTTVFIQRQYIDERFEAYQRTLLAC